MPILRALFVALDQWVTTGRTPPASRVPSIAANTLVEPVSMGFPSLPGGGIARKHNEVEPPGNWVDPHEVARKYRPLVCKVDADGNEVAGVLTPDIAVPLGTYTGWNLYKKPYPEGELADRDGSFIAFAATSAERVQSGDPRKSIAERYGSPEDYLNKVTAATTALLDDRLLLPEDAAAYIERARSAVKSWNKRDIL